MTTTRQAHTRPIPAVGDEVPTRTWPSDFSAWNRYAAVNDEFYPVHMDHEAARAQGMPGAIGMGNLQTAYFNVLLADWAGDHGRVHRLAISFRGPSVQGTVTAGGTVTAVEETSAGTSVSFDVWTRDHEGRDLCTGTAVVALDA